MSQVIGIIPARMGSSRFPGKPLADILGMPMIGHMWNRCCLSQLISEWYVATCDQEIFDYVEGIGGNAIMTKDTHERCTDRTSEALDIVEKRSGKKVDIVLMVQGDEPMVHPESLDCAVQLMLENPSMQIVNLVGKLELRQQYEDPNQVKVVMSPAGRILYYSRAPIPSDKKFEGDIPTYRQLGIIAFKRDFLVQYFDLAPTPLETIESVDMLRVLEHGYAIEGVVSLGKNYSVDTPHDLSFVQNEMKLDGLVHQYL
jgi:3-deoxy-manno-octulosonate cytidylyltransferase (CMP-KDO synthetase)